ncbi:MAG: UbiA family prenyltransferase [Pirellulaceae bacterium]
MKTPTTPDELAVPTRSTAPPSKLLAWLRLMRLPNVFTALADVTMGFLVARQSLEPLGALVALAASSALLYTAGMVLNDVFDIDIDARERPHRPLPSGRIPLLLARALGFAMLALGVLFGWLSGLAFADAAAAPWRSGVMATILASLVILYDACLKRTPFGPVGMGACRSCNVLLGMSLAPADSFSPDWLLGYAPAQWLIAGGIGVYIAGVTWFARDEATSSRGAQLLGAMAVMTTGVALLALGVSYLPALQLQPSTIWILFALLMLTVLRRAFAAVTDPSPQRVQAAVKHSILSLIWLDAALIAAVAPLGFALAVAALLIPALLLGRWVYST